MASIPKSEIDGLNDAIDEAIGRASDGQFAAGYTLLLDGLHHAQKLRQIGAPWAVPLIRHYRHAITAYIDSFGVAMEEPL
jgi:hypothetical protein